MGLIYWRRSKAHTKKYIKTPLFRFLFEARESGVAFIFKNFCRKKEFLLFFLYLIYIKLKMAEEKGGLLCRMFVKS